MKRSEAQVAIELIAEKADNDFGDFASVHEAYGVLAEEVDEFFRSVQMRQSNPDRLVQCEKEALDIAAVALRIAEQAHRLTR